MALEKSQEKWESYKNKDLLFMNLVMRVMLITRLMNQSMKVMIVFQETLIIKNVRIKTKSCWKILIKKKRKKNLQINNFYINLMN